MIGCKFEFRLEPKIEYFVKSILILNRIYKLELQKKIDFKNSISKFKIRYKIGIDFTKYSSRNSILKKILGFKFESSMIEYDLFQNSIFKKIII